MIKNPLLIPNKTSLIKKRGTITPLKKSAENEYLDENTQIKGNKIIWDKQQQYPDLVITNSLLTLYSWEDMKKKAQEIEIHNSEYEGNSSIGDARMGPNDAITSNVACSYCFQIQCPGHCGLIDFNGIKVYNPLFIHLILYVLVSICHDCNRILIPDKKIKEYGLLKMKGITRLKKFSELSKNTKCNRQYDQDGEGEINPCKNNPDFKTSKMENRGNFYLKSTESEKRNSTDGRVQPKIIDIETVYDILDNISDEDSLTLGFNKGSHPRNAVLQGILIMPNMARPFNYVDGIKRASDFSSYYAAIVKSRNELALGTKSDNGVLYAWLNKFFNGRDPPDGMYTEVINHGKKGGGNAVASLKKSIKGKTGLLRKNGVGKRGNFSSRSVAGPDATLKYGEVSYPMIWSKTQTKPRKINDHNIEYYLEVLDKGNVIRHVRDNVTRMVKDENKDRISLRVGDTVHVKLQDNDMMVINRQPTLHKQSMMGYEVKLKDQLNIGNHISVTTPMNLDFDGDEVNASNPQNPLAEAEVMILMNVTENIISPQKNMPSMGMVMNGVLGSYLLSFRSYLIDDILFSRILRIVDDHERIDSLAVRLERYGIHPRSGRAIFSLLLPIDFFYENGDVIIMEGILISGLITKKQVGVAHRSMVQEIHKKYGKSRTVQFLTESPFVINTYLVEVGFTVGLNDIFIPEIDPDTGETYDKNQRVVKEDLSRIREEIKSLGGKYSDSGLEEIRKRNIASAVDKAESIGKKLTKESLRPDNSIRIMTNHGSGTKGTIVNLSQIMGPVGQQFLRGERLKPEISSGRRLLPCYDPDSNEAGSNGFIFSSYFTGLNPDELFNLQTGAREGLLDTSLNTSVTGTMQRYMEKAFENIVIGIDGSVRNTMGILFNTSYNSGFEISEMLQVNGYSNFIDIRQIFRESNFKRGWTTSTIKRIINKNKKEKGSFNEIILKINDNYKKPLAFLNPEKYIEIEKPNLEIIPKAKITRFEKSRLVGTRAMQIENNENILINPGKEFNSVKIALMEYEQGLLPIFIIRKYPNGEIEKIFPTLDNI